MITVTLIVILAISQRIDLTR